MSIFSGVRKERSLYRRIVFSQLLLRAEVQIKHKNKSEIMKPLIWAACRLSYSVKASLTVEAALIMPFFIIAVSQIIFWTGFLEVQAELNAEVNSISRRMAETAFIEMDGEVFQEPENIEIAKGELLNGIYFERLSVARPFVGRCYKEADYNSTDSDERAVFVTKNGKVYHTSNVCTHIKLSVREVAHSSVSALRNEGGGKYYPCEYCMRKKVADRVYITGEGSRIHADKNCGGIKRTVNIMVKRRAEAEGYSPCMRCGKIYD